MATDNEEQLDRPLNEYWEFESTIPILIEGGIQARTQSGRFTESWWAGRWLRALTQWIDPTRLSRGRAYARAGQVVDLTVQPGLVLATVQGTRPEPYRVQAEIKVFGEAEWERVLDTMALQAIYAAQLLNGEMPHDITDLFSTVGVSLFPTLTGDLTTECSCPDWANPCKHIAAVYYLLGERLDEDPFLLFTMRGRTKDQIVAALRARRADHALDRQRGEDSRPAGLDSASGPPLEACLETFWQMGPEISAIQVKVAPSDVERELLKVLGIPPFAEGKGLAEHLEDIYRAVSQRALEVAFGEHA
jgi:uncharacterized Zn finger protein